MCKQIHILMLNLQQMLQKQLVDKILKKKKKKLNKIKKKNKKKKKKIVNNMTKNIK